MTSEITHLRACNQTIFRIRIPTQRKYTNENKTNANSKQNLAVFSVATDSEHKIIQILHRKGQNKIWTELSSLGQEPTFKAISLIHSFSLSELLIILNAENLSYFDNTNGRNSDLPPSPVKTMGKIIFIGVQLNCLPLYYTTLAINRQLQHEIIHTERGLYWLGWYKIVILRFVRCTRSNSLAKVRGLSLCTGRQNGLTSNQTVLHLLCKWAEVSQNLEFLRNFTGTYF